MELEWRVALHATHNPHMPTTSGMPPRLSSFVGRRKEFAELRRLLPHTRLLTLLGSGGSGKTRLATEFVHHREAQMAERAVFADLSVISDGGLVVEVIGRAAGIRLQGRDHLGSLIRQLQHRRLIVVDNCEHLVGPAADVVAQLLTGCPQLTVIATSRERLKVEGETIYRVPPLSVPTEGLDVAAADVSDAARLFVDRARSVRPGFVLDASNAAAVLTICRRLNGIPLAIELAAARMTTLSPHDIVPRLEDSLRLLTGGSRNAVSRQHTLRATIDWSYQLLDITEQRLLQRFSVFAGSPDIDGVQEVCAFPPLEPGDVLDALTRLVEKSMVQIENHGERTRYRLLETIREYAGEKLTLEGHDAAVRDRHLTRYRRLVAEASEARRHRGAMIEHRLIWAEMNDVRAALEWARRDPDVELEMLGNLFLIWMVNSPTEGFGRLTDVLRSAEPRPTQTFLMAALAWGALGGLTGRPLDRVEPPEELAERLMALARDSNDPFIAATIEISIGYELERRLGDLERAQPHMVAAVGVFQELGPSPTMAMAMGSLGSIEARMGRPDTGRRWIEKAVAMALQVDDEFGTIGAYFHLGCFELDHGTRDKALAAFLAALDLVESDDILSITDQVAGVACAMASVDARYALRLFSAAARLRSLVDTSGGGLWAPRVEKGAQEARASLPEREAGAAWVSADGLTPDALRLEIRERFSAAASPRRKAAHGLSEREMEVANLVAAGMTSRAIGEKLFLAERTVETHLNHIMTKLGFNSRAQVAAWITELRAASRPGG
jgi:non-specific serine/threonine protein kinase